MLLTLQALVAFESALFEVRLELAQLHLEDCKGTHTGWGARKNVGIMRTRPRVLAICAPPDRTREIQWPVLVHVSQLRPKDVTMPSNPSLERPCRLDARVCPSSLAFGSGGPIDGVASLLPVLSSICHFTSRLPNCAEAGTQRSAATTRRQVGCMCRPRRQCHQRALRASSRRARLSCVVSEAVSPYGKTHARAMLRRDVSEDAIDFLFPSIFMPCLSSFSSASRRR